MNSEEIIASFWQVWQDKPNLFLVADVEKDLADLSQEITSLSNPSNNVELVAQKIQAWCKKHPSIRDLVRVSTRKPKPKKADDKSVAKTLDNRFTELSKVLQEIVNQSQHG